MTLAVVFPGQGSQSPGMLADLAARYPIINETFTEAADHSGTDLWALAQTGSAEQLSDTRITQPLMLTADVALWRALRAEGLPMPAVAAGHSLGEFPAMVACGVLTFTDALALVQRRAALMAEAVPEGEGGMAALIGMDDAAVVELCAAISGERISEAANFNAPGQVAVSGHLDALEHTVQAAKEQGCRKAMMLAVSVPNHSSLMRPAGQALAHIMDTLSFAEPAVPLVQNGTAQVPDTLDALVTQLKAHVYSPVYWTRSVEHLRDAHQVSLILEVGPGKVLCGLCKRIDRSLTALPTDTPDSFSAALTAVQAA